MSSTTQCPGGTPFAPQTASSLTRGAVEALVLDLGALGIGSHLFGTLALLLLIARALALTGLVHLNAPVKIVFGIHVEVCGLEPVCMRGALR